MLIRFVLTLFASSKDSQSAMLNMICNYLLCETSVFNGFLFSLNLFNNEDKRQKKISKVSKPSLSNWSLSRVAPQITGHETIVSIVEKYRIGAIQQAYHADLT